VRYTHFQNNDPGEIWTWYYRNFSDIFPDCDSECCAYPADATCCDPDGYPLGCSSTHITPVGKQASLYQRDVIDDGTAPHKSGDDAAEDCEYGDQYKWLQGISDRDQSELYRHWGVSGSTVTETTRRHLCQTAIAVFHREHWYERSYNSLSQADNPSATDTDNTAAPCGSAKWWIFACTGCVVYSWEVKSSSLDATIGADTADAFLVKVNAGEPVPEAWLDVLVSDGIIDIGDHEQPGGEIIKKTLTHYSTATGGRPTSEVAYFYGREAGWTYVCEDFTAGNEEDVMDADFPQIVRRSSETCHTPVGSTNCHTAAPLPANGCTECATTAYGDPASIGCNPCDDPVGDCVNPVLAICGDGDYSCDGDIVVGTCRGVWVQYWAYLFAKPSGAYTENYVCANAGVNNGYLCRIADATDTCVWRNLPTDIHHQIPSTVSGSMRDGTSNTAQLCCGGEGTINYSDFKCPAATPNSQGCPTPPIWGPTL
tara:strand:+ start:1903 stop:3351 length:1449 start_codon:yes stop_codon:yes gene_type:complete